MTDQAQAEPRAQIAENAEAAPSLLDQALHATKQTEPERAGELLRALTEQALEGTVTWNKNLTQTLNSAIEKIDAVISKQLATLMHHQDFQKLEGSWRGLHYLVMNSETSSSLRLRVLNATKKELHKDLSRAVEFDQSQLFKKVYENEFGTPGGEPYAALVGDYEFSNHPEDVELLRNVSSVSAAAFAPFITAPSAQLFGFEQWQELSKPRDIEKIFDSAEYTQWRSFRESDDARFVTMVMPRVLARLPYGEATRPIDECRFEEVAVDHNDYCWMNAAYVMGTKLTNAYAEHGWCTAIRGMEGGGKVEGLPTHVFTSDDGDPDIKCPTEIGITDRREAELSKQGFLPLCHYKNTDHAVFFGAQTAQKCKNYDKPEAQANALISTRLPYIMATSRFAHYLKVMARDKVGSFASQQDIESWLDRWISNYINANPVASQESRAKYPLADAKVVVKEIPGKPGSYHAIAWLKPWLQLEELTTSLRMVARIPGGE